MKIETIQTIVLFIAMAILGFNVQATPVGYSYVSTTQSIYQTRMEDGKVIVTPVTDGVTLGAAPTMYAGTEYVAQFVYDIDKDILSKYVLTIDDISFDFDILTSAVVDFDTYTSYTMTGKKEIEGGLLSSTFNVLLDDIDAGNGLVPSTNIYSKFSDVVRYSFGDNESYQIFGLSVQGDIPIRTGNVPSVGTFYLMLLAIGILLMRRKDVSKYSPGL
jgi:hypothetical protein